MFNPMERLRYQRIDYKGLIKYLCKKEVYEIKTKVKLEARNNN